MDLLMSPRPLDPATLIVAASAAGLRIDREGDRLAIAGPRPLGDLAGLVLRNAGSILGCLDRAEGPGCGSSGPAAPAWLVALEHLEDFHDFEERAAILEHDGVGMPREEAERHALRQLRPDLPEWGPAAHSEPPGKSPESSLIIRREQEDHHDG